MEVDRNVSCTRREKEIGMTKKDMKAYDQAGTLNGMQEATKLKVGKGVLIIQFTEGH
jgi:hypothetical protein